MRPDYAPRAEYVGLGNKSDYTFDFKITDLSQLLVVHTDVTNEILHSVRGDDITFLSSVVYDVLAGGGTVNLLANLPANENLFLILADDEPTQDDAYNNKSDFTLKRFENSLDRLAGQIQSLAYKAGRSLRISETHFDLELDTLLPRLIAGDVIIVNDDGDGFDAVNLENFVRAIAQDELANADIPGQIQAYVDGLNLSQQIADEVAAQMAATGGLPVGGVAGDFVEKIGPTDGDADWLSGTFAGYSARYSASLSLIGLRAALLYIFNFQYTLPSISLSMVGSGTIREKGASVASSLMTAAITKTSDPIQAVRFYASGVLQDTQTGNPPVPSGGSPTYNYATAFTDTKSFTAQVDDDGTSNGGTPQTATSNTVTFTFVYPYYYGSNAAGLTGAQVRSLLTTYVIASTASVNRSFTPNGTQKMYFAYPASYGDLTSIKDDNLFEVLPDWTKSTKNITGLDGAVVSYNVYEFNNVATAGTYGFTFIR